MNYVLGSSSLEVKRLDIQSEIFEKETLHTLLRAGVKKGMRCLEFGCGTGNATFMIADLVGNMGEVVGLDMSRERISICKRRARERDCRNVRFFLGNAYNTQFKNSSFDFVFSRFLFQHLTDPVEALKEMLRVTRKGGIIAAEEFVYSSWLSYPYDPIIEKLRRSYVKVARLADVDPFVARNLYKFFLGMGLHPNVEVYCVSVPIHNKLHIAMIMLLATIIREKLLKSRLMSKREFQRMYNELLDIGKRADGRVLYSPTVRIWSRVIDV